MQTRESNVTTGWRGGFCNLGVFFRLELQRFVDGMPRQLCNDAFLSQLCIFRLFPVSETSIEAAHSRVALSSSKHHIGPVRVSLSNRLRLIEASIARDEEFGKQLLQCFSSARSLKTIAAELNLEGHPLWCGKDTKLNRLHTSQSRILLTAMIYHCDIEARFHSMKEFMKSTNQKKARRQRLLTRLCGGTPQPDVALIYRTALLDYVQAQVQPGEFYSVGHEVFVGMESLQGDTPATEWRQAAIPVKDEDIDFDMDTEQAKPKPDSVFFQIVSAKPGQRKILKGGVGTGNVIRKHHIALTLHAQLGGDDAAPIVGNKPIVGAAGNVVVLDQIGDP